MSSAGSAAFVRTTEVPWQVTGPGVRRQILGYGPDLMMVRVDFEQGAVGTLHHHPHRQVTYVVSGQFEASIDGVTTMLGPGDCFYVGPELVHGVVAHAAGTLVDVFTPAREDFLT